MIAHPPTITRKEMDDDSKHRHVSKIQRANSQLVVGNSEESARTALDDRIPERPNSIKVQFTGNPLHRPVGPSNQDI